jgi:hypothetical protein
MVRSRKAKPPLTRTRIYTSMNELEIHLTERAIDFPLLAQFFFKQPERLPALRYAREAEQRPCSSLSVGTERCLSLGVLDRVARRTGSTHHV